MQAYIVALCMMIVGIAMGEKSVSKQRKSDPNDNRGNVPFFLQDPYDQMCLGPDGFTNCDERALWILTKRPGKKTYSLVSFLNPSSGSCLQRQPSFFGLFSSDKLVSGPCSKGNAKNWNFDFIDQNHVKLSNQGQCIVRGKKGHKSSASVASCKKSDFLPLIYHPTAVHENGFYLKAADGKCFDGNAFKTCTSSTTMLWGNGIRYVWGEAMGYIFSYARKEPATCISTKGKKIIRGDCFGSGALGWGWHDGKVTTKNGKQCLVRMNDDSAALAPCSQGSEFITIDLPTVMTEEELAAYAAQSVSVL